MPIMKISSQSSRFLEPMGLFCISLLIFCWGVATQEVIGFESRFYFFALEMWRYGFSWFPTTYQQPYPDYPVTSTLLIYLFAQLFGSLHKLTAVLPSAIAAAVTVAMTYSIGSLHSKKLAACAVFLLFLTLTFLKDARSISLDMYPTMAVACSFYLIHSAEILHKPKRIHWIYFFLLIGFMFRGPIGLIMPAGVVSSYYFLNREFKKLFVFGLLALLLLTVCMAILLSLAHYYGGTAFMQDVLRMQVLGRIDNKYLPFYFYFSNSFGSYALSYPLAWLVLVALLYHFFKAQVRAPEAKFVWHLFGWMLIILIGMSIPGDKKVRYILPMAPTLALIAAHLFAGNEKQIYFRKYGEIISKVLLFFPAIFLLTTELLYFYTQKSAFAALPIFYVPLLIFFMGMQLLAFALVYRYILYTKVVRTSILFIASLSFIVMYIAIIEPIILYVERARDFVESVEAERLEQGAGLVFYKERPDGLAIKYLINTVEVKHPIFIDNEAALVQFSQPAFFVTKEPFFSKLPEPIKNRFKIIGHDKLGHVNVVVFSNGT